MILLMSLTIFFKQASVAQLVTCQLVVNSLVLFIQYYLLSRSCLIRYNSKILIQSFLLDSIINLKQSVATVNKYLLPIASYYGGGSLKGAYTLNGNGVVFGCRVVHVCVPGLVFWVPNFFPEKAGNSLS